MVKNHIVIILEAEMKKILLIKLLNLTKSFLTSKYNYHFLGLFHYSNIFSGVDQTIDHFVPFETYSIIHKLRRELIFNYKWFTVDEHN